MKIAQLLKMPVGERVGGGFVLTVKKTKKAVQLPGKRYIHTVVLFDDTGEMLADFKDPGGAGAYNPIIKGWQVKIIVAEIQTADLTGRSKVDQKGVKLYVDQFSLVTDFEPEDDYPDWRTTVRGKIRHGIVCSLLRAGFNIYDDIPKTEIEALIEYIMGDEQ